MTMIQTPLDSLEASSQLHDNYNRLLNYLRISITDRCNFACLYCMPGEPIPKLGHREILRYEEILRVVKIGAGMGISKIRVTGGEPLIRKGVYEFLEQITAIPGIADLSLTTNGRLLKKNIDRLKAAGIRRLNISLDSLDPRNYARITGHDVFDVVWEGILSALESGFSPIKLNAVALRGINEHELVDLAKLSIQYPFHIRFIERMPTLQQSAWNNSAPPLLEAEIKEKIATLGPLTPIQSETLDGPARRFQLPGAKGEIGIISPLSHHFCATCNRLRLTANGRLRACLLEDRSTDLITPLRNGCTDSQIAALLITAAGQKPKGHGMTPQSMHPIQGQMSAIGG